MARAPQRVVPTPRPTAEQYADLVLGRVVRDSRSLINVVPRLRETEPMCSFILSLEDAAVTALEYLRASRPR